MNKKTNNKFMYLFNNEVSRSLKLFIPFILLFFAGHVGLYLKKLFQMNSNIKKFIAEGNTIEKYILENGKITFTSVINKVSDQLLLIICFGILLILLYAAIIWLREWFGNNKTVYTFLTLPVSRHKIILSKFLCIFLLGATYLSTQITTFFLDNFLLTVVMPSKVVEKTGTIKSFFESHMCLLFPNTIMNFLFLVTIIICAVLIMFNWVMLERSFRWKGIIIGAINVIITGCLYILVPKKANFFISETITYFSLLSIVLIILNYYSCHYLLKNKAHI